MQVSNDQIEKVTDSLVQACSDMNNIVRDSWSAALQSASIVTRGCEEVCETVSAMVQKSLDQSTYASKALMSAKTMNDLMDTHSSLLKSGFDSVMEEMNRLSQISARIAQQAAEPVTNSVNATISKISKVKAA